MVVSLFLSTYVYPLLSACIFLSNPMCFHLLLSASIQFNLPASASICQRISSSICPASASICYFYLLLSVSICFYLFLFYLPGSIYLRLLLCSSICSCLLSSASMSFHPHLPASVCFYLRVSAFIYFSSIYFTVCYIMLYLFLSIYCYLLLSAPTCFLPALIYQILSTSSFLFSIHPYIMLTGPSAFLSIYSTYFRILSTICFYHSHHDTNLNDEEQKPSISICFCLHLPACTCSILLISSHIHFCLLLSVCPPLLLSASTYFNLFLSVNSFLLLLSASVCFSLLLSTSIIYA